MLAQERPLRTLQQAYIIFTAAWFLNLLFEQTHQDSYTMQRWTRILLKPFNREIRYHTLTNHLLYRAIYLPPVVLRTGRNLRGSAPN